MILKETSMGAINLDRLLGNTDIFVEQSETLTFRDSSKNSAKFYEIRIESNLEDKEKPYRCVVQYGRIGSKGRVEVKYAGLSLSQCESLKYEIAREKKRRAINKKATFYSGSFIRRRNDVLQIHTDLLESFYKKD